MYCLTQIPDFAVRAEKVRSLTNALYINTYSYVEKDQRSEWEAYSAENGPAWVEQTLNLQFKEGLFTDVLEAAGVSSIDDVGMFNVIWDYG